MKIKRLQDQKQAMRHIVFTSVAICIKLLCVLRHLTL